MSKQFWPRRDFDGLEARRKQAGRLFAAGRLNQAEIARRLDVFVSVPATAPLRTPQDVTACISTLLEGDADVVISVTPARRHPRFNMVTLEAGYARLLDPAPGGAPYRRQDAPPVFDMTTAAYAARPDYVLAARSIFEGRVKAVVLPQERALDIDTELDLRLAELLLHDAGRD